MKLYAYVLRSNIYTKDKSFHAVELEVKECPRTYVITGEIPKDLYIPSRISKSDVNGFAGYTFFDDVIELDHPDLKMAKRLFLDSYVEQIRECRSKIKYLESLMAVISDYKEDESNV